MNCFALIASLKTWKSYKNSILIVKVLKYFLCTVVPTFYSNDLSEKNVLIDNLYVE